MMMKKFFIFLMFIALMAACAESGRHTLNLNGHILNIEIANTPDSRAHGLMNRSALAADSGMLFVFADEGIRSFWMKNTAIPLSIAYIDKNGKIRSIHSMTPGSLESIRSTLPVQYALEVNEGYFEKVGIKVGDILDIPKEFKAES
jgi:uncharacterized membrane protein (UPF0127 family)